MPLCSSVFGASSHHPVQMLCSPVDAHWSLERTPQTVVSETVFVVSFSWVAFPEYRDTKDNHRYFNIHLFYYKCFDGNSILTPTCSRARTDDFFALEEYDREHDLLQKRLVLEKKVSLVPGVPHISHSTVDESVKITGQTNTTQVTLIVGKVCFMYLSMFTNTRVPEFTYFIFVCFKTSNTFTARVKLNVSFI